MSQKTSVHRIDNKRKNEEETSSSDGQQKECELLACKSIQRIKSILKLNTITHMDENVECKDNAKPLTEICMNNYTAVELLNDFFQIKIITSGEPNNSLSSHTPGGTTNNSLPTTSNTSNTPIPSRRQSNTSNTPNILHRPSNTSHRPGNRRIPSLIRPSHQLQNDPQSHSTTSSHQLKYHLSNTNTITFQFHELKEQYQWLQHLFLKQINKHNTNIMNVNLANICKLFANADFITFWMPNGYMLSYDECVSLLKEDLPLIAAMDMMVTINFVWCNKMPMINKLRIEEYQQVLKQINWRASFSINSVSFQCVGDSKAVEEFIESKPNCDTIDLLRNVQTRSTMYALDEQTIKSIPQLFLGDIHNIQPIFHDIDLNDSNKIVRYITHSSNQASLAQNSNDNFGNGGKKRNNDDEHARQEKKDENLIPKSALNPSAPVFVSRVRLPTIYEH
eukprot:536847_1